MATGTSSFGSSTVLGPAARSLLPATAALAALVVTGLLPAFPAFLGWILASCVSYALALRRRRRIDLASAYLDALIDGRDPGPPPEHNLLDEGGLYHALPRLRRTLAERRRLADMGLVADLLQTVIDGIDDPLIVIDARRRIVRANGYARELFPAAAVDAPLINSLRDPSLIAAVDASLAGGTSSQLFLSLKATPPRAFAARVVPLQAGPLGHTAVLSLRERTEAVQIERMRSDFVANASHEIRTPLTAIRGFIETLQGPARDDKRARERFLAIMAQEAERMGRLVDDLLSLSRIELAEHQVPRERVDIGMLIGRVVDSLIPAADRRDVRLALNPPDVWPPVVGDADQLFQVFQNLVENAIIHGGSGKTVTVDGRIEQASPHDAGPLSGTRALAVTVSDQGEGIPEAIIPRVTERFFRADNPRSRKEGGTGLGLAIVKHVLRRHRGHLAIRSTLGEGSQFTAYLPLA
ncbi:ATP-binding protein [Marinivivus vitaminiproducens]|uniref:ATP-binding protein n=1 Tax=Marinivivus vitaminiproducens TaxID=3035935 RepID=UPI0027A43AD0|nr:ATP-binding protein [Geminicoccaceae bacterium SCSIO 64248]